MTKKLVNGNIVSTKDENGAYVPSHLIPEAPRKRKRLPRGSDISLSTLMDRYMVLLYQETKALIRESLESGKLCKDSAMSMRENARLIMDLKKKEKELLDNLTNEELDQLIKNNPNDKT